MSSDPLPRVNGDLMGRYLGTSVLLCGEIMQSMQSMVRLKSPDGRVITVHLPAGEQCETKFVQVVGKVKSNDEIEAHYIIPGDDNFSMENYNTAVTLSHSDKFKDLFQ